MAKQPMPMKKKEMPMHDMGGGKMMPGKKHMMPEQHEAMHGKDKKKGK